MRDGGIGRRAELVEIAARAETGTGTIEHDATNRVIHHGDFQSFAQAITKSRSIGIALVGPVEGDVQGIGVAFDEHGR